MSTHGVIRWSRICFAVLAACALPLAAAAQAGPAPEEKEAAVPLTRLVLFTSGVGYFQHDGVVEGNARMELTFSAAQINDLLKSLVLRDMDGGSITSVTYSSRDPITRTLKSFALDLTANPSLAGLLTQARGEAIEATMTAGTKVTGAIVGVESRQIATGAKEPVSAEFLTLNTSGGMASLALSEVLGIRFLRREMQDDLAQALQVLSSSHGVERKKLILHFTGSGKRRVSIGYILECPVWKTSYRLVLGDAASHLLQGWALVENTTDGDWKNVGLNLVSGRPITFVMDLYQPLYIQRPEVQLELYQSLVPRTNQMAMEEAPAAPEADEAVAESAPARRAAAPLAKAAPAPQPSAGFLAGPGAGRDMGIAQGVSAAAQGGQIGDLFQYAIEKPVTLPRLQSAMLPIINQQVSGDRVSLYNEGTHPKYPLNAVRLKNTSSLHLMQGPITVFDGGSYAGDAQITDMAPGATQLITYAMDLDTEVEAVAGPTPSSLVSVKISKGIFFSTTKLQQERIYNARNRGAKDRTVLIEHPYQADWTLVAPKQAAERTRNDYRFELPVAAGKAGKLSVVETRTVDQSVALASLTGDQVAFYVNSAVASPAVKAALQKLSGMMAKISDTISRRTREEARVNDISNDQSRIRSNMDRLSQGSDLYKRYVKTLSDEEDELAKLREDIARLRDLEASQRSDVEKFIQSVDAG
ncbi:MAG TPA: hypothetical protein VMV03_11165 [Spirochaetia bacterium]|nr:hypothetical protein [Spirochaetia bacterium]